MQSKLSSDELSPRSCPIEEQMKTKSTKNVILGVLALALSSGAAFGVVDQALQIQCTNLILSWPSRGYEYYMIECRPTLDPSTPWGVLTNNYHANSTNRSTYTLSGIVPNGCSGGTSMAQGGG